MDQQIVDQLVEILQADFEKYQADAEELLAQNPGLDFDVIDAMIPETDLNFPENLKGFDEEYDTAVVIVSLNAMRNAMGL